MEPEKKKQKMVDLNTKLAIVKHLDEDIASELLLISSTFPKEQSKLLRGT
jgi:hypothetical protein